MDTGYYDWKRKINDKVPENMKIDDDLYIVENADHHDSIGIPRKVDVSTFIIIDKGCSKAMVDGRTFDVVSPSIAVVMPAQTYQLLEASDDISCRVVIMSRRFTDNLFGSFPQSNELYRLICEYPVIDISKDVSSFNTYYRVLLNAVKSPFKVFRLEAASHLTLSMLYYYSRRLVRLEQEKEKKDMLYEAFCADVRQNYRTVRTLSFYSGRLSVSTKYLTELIKEKEGITASDYIDQATVTECKALLTSTDLTINQISRSMHFLSPSVFGKFFKRMTGVSPTEYREGTR